MLNKLLISFFLAAFALASPLHADDTIWSALVLATNDSASVAEPAELAPVAKKLRAVFGYTHFQLLGQQSEKMDDPTERWIVLGGKFSLSLTSRRAAMDAYALALTLYQDKRLLVRAETELSPGGPLFIRGPLFGRGQLIIVLLVR